LQEEKESRNGTRHRALNPDAMRHHGLGAKRHEAIQLYKRRIKR